jgi:DHA1 family bicyclomycin/chloramphenicol resistance-like MFS transporter
VALTHLFTQSAVALILPVAFYALGMALSMPALSLMGLDMFPTRRGMASAMQGAMQMSSNSFISAFVVVALAVSVQWLALGQLAISLSALVLWVVWIRLRLRHGDDRD